jgi:hypothetical protein
MRIRMAPCRTSPSISSPPTAWRKAKRHEANAFQRWQMPLNKHHQLHAPPALEHTCMYPLCSPPVSCPETSGLPGPQHLPPAAAGPPGHRYARCPWPARGFLPPTADALPMHFSVQLADACNIHPLPCLRCRSSKAPSRWRSPPPTHPLHPFSSPCESDLLPEYPCNWNCAPRRGAHLEGLTSSMRFCS